MGHILGTKPFTLEQLLDFCEANGHREDDCVLWAGSFSGEGRPRVMWKRRFYMVQRLLLEHRTNRWNPEHKAHATCGNRSCVNPAHLTMRSRADIVRQAAKDKPRKGLLIALGRAPKARFGIDKAREAATMRANGADLATIAARYGVTRSCVCTCMNNWKRMGVI